MKLVLMFLMFAASCGRSDPSGQRAVGAVQGNPAAGTSASPVNETTPTSQDMTRGDAASRPRLQDVPAVGSVTATTLAGDFQSNQIRASRLYGGKVYEITGRLAAAEDDADGPYLILRGESSDVMCRVERSELPAVARFMPHSEVTVKGVITDGSTTRGQVRCRSCAGVVHVEPCIMARCKTVQRDCLPDVTYVDAQGHPLTSESLADKVVVVIVCATWAHPCQRWMSELSRAYDKYKTRGVLFLGVLTDKLDDDNLLGFQSDLNISYPVIRANPEILTAYNFPDALPTTFVFDQAGRLVARQVGTTQYHALDIQLGSLVGTAVR